MIANFTKEDILDSHRKFNISDKAVWVQKFNFSKVASKVLASVKPKLVFGETNKETREILSDSGVIVVDTIKPEIRKHYAAVSPVKVENEMKKIEKKNFIRWLDEYKQRS
jgi:hypothetical protein